MDEYDRDRTMRAKPHCGHCGCDLYDDGTCPEGCFALWSGSCCSVAPDSCWIDDVTNEHVDARTGQRSIEHPV